MKCSLKFAPFWMLFAIAVWFPASPTAALAQNQGQNAVYNSVAMCCTDSSAFFDANMFLPPNGTQASDICDAIYYVLTHGYVAGGGVIDARGIGTALTCTKGSPWNESGSYANKPSTILLPAGTINISTGWVLPNGTTLVGEGTSNPALNLSNNQLQTTILALDALSSGPMIQFGDSNCPGSPTPTCTGISIESLTLVGNSHTLTGIENQNSADRSYVNHVSLYNVIGTGLVVSGNAQNSGPYSNINYDTGSSGVFNSTCASINGLAGTRGIHGLSCKSSTDSQVAVLLNSSNNALEDVRIVRFNKGRETALNSDQPRLRLLWTSDFTV